LIFFELIKIKKEVKNVIINKKRAVKTALMMIKACILNFYSAGVVNSNVSSATLFIPAKFAKPSFGKNR
jgi:hypothetical protein